eukprot:TRINITY_DN10998_c0_g1_i1.p1 TRINITY_DN10998_c0_g1~~TRINITY_DN10998_c0_g1_i1.p1  ORF type:complete len:231 (+),score=61.91 TRINITY_DN10998_c0_g1_i1:49-741(+)
MTAALVAAVSLGLIRQWMWGADSWVEVLTVFSVISVVLFILLLLPAPRKLILTALASPRKQSPAVQLQRDKRFERSGKRGALQQQEKEKVPPVPPTDGRRVRLTNSGRVFGMLNDAKDIAWPSEEMKALGGSSGWGGWHPTAGVEGTVSHCWIVPDESVTTLDPLHHCRLPVDIIVVRVFIQHGQGGDFSHRFFAAAIDALEPADGCDEPIKLPRDGDAASVAKKCSGVL